jgi:hypothetical protein
MLSLFAASGALVAPQAPVSIDRLTVNLTPDDHKKMSGLTTSLAATILSEHGVVLLKGALPIELVDEAADAVATSFDRCRTALKDRGLKPQKPFAFAEIAHRSKLRYDMQVAEAATALPTSLVESPPWRPLLDRALGDDHIDLFQGAVIAEPGAADQQPHMDGGHLYQGTHGYEQAQNPPHCLNVFVPLVDVTEENGPTEFWPGSHVLTQARAAFAGVTPSVSLAGARGDAIVFDYRVVHRGRENVAETTRPVLYLTSCRSWFRDAQNFPEERLLGPSPTAGGASGTPAGGFGASKAKAAKPMKAKAKKRK